MRPFLYRCPATGLRVQGLDPSHEVGDDDDVALLVTCHACGRAHLVNPMSGETRKDGE